MRIDNIERKCPYCGSTINGIETQCPNCGYKGAGFYTEKSKEDSDDNSSTFCCNPFWAIEWTRRAKSTKRGLLIALSAFVILGTLFGLLFEFDTKTVYYSSWRGETCSYHVQRIGYLFVSALSYIIALFVFIFACTFSPNNAIETKQVGGHFYLAYAGVLHCRLIRDGKEIECRNHSNGKNGLVMADRLSNGKILSASFALRGKPSFNVV